MPNIPVTWRDEQTVNAVTSGAQYDPDIIQLANGNILVVWTSENNTGAGSPAGSDVIGRIFDPLGNPVTGEFLINVSSSLYSEGLARIAALPGGGFVAVYQYVNQISPTIFFTNLVLEEFDASGASVGYAEAASAPEGVVAVSSATSVLLIYDTPDNIEGKLYNADTNTLGSAFVVLGGANSGDVTVLASGNYVVAGTLGSAIAYTLRTPTGATVLASTLVTGTDTNAGSDLGASVTALPGGGFVIAWVNSQAGDTDIEFRVYNANGAQVGAGEVAAGASGNANADPVVTGLADGSFVITYDNNSALNRQEVEHFSGAGASLGTFSYSGAGGAPAATALADGRFAVAWQNGAGEIALEILDTRDNGNATSVYTPTRWQVGTIGDDTITADANAFLLEGWEGNDTLIGNAGDNRLVGHTGNDQLFGGAGVDQLRGSDGDDLLDGGASADDMSGGQGNDTYFVDSPGDTVAELPGQGTDTVQTALGDKTAPAFALYYIPFNVENLVATSNAGQGVGGNALNNAVTAGSGADLIAMHQGGVDNVNAGAGADYIWFGATLTADDVVNGGLGRDTLAILGPYANLSLGANVTNIERLELYSSPGAVTYNITLADSVNTPHPNFFEVVALSLSSSEHLIFDGSSDSDSRYFIRGGAGNDTLRAGAGNDRIVGNDGNDQLFGNAGNDTLVGGNGQDTYDTGAGSDTIEVLSAAQSTSTTYDILAAGFDPSVDRIDVSGTFAGWAAAQTGALNQASFNTDLANAVNAALGANQAVKFTANAGDQIGKIFVVYDANGDGNYTAGADYVFQFVAPGNLEGSSIFV